MNKLFLMLPLVLFVGCNNGEPSRKSDEHISVRSNGWTDIFIYHDDKRGITCYTRGIDTLSCVADRVDGGLP